MWEACQYGCDFPAKYPPDTRPRPPGGRRKKFCCSEYPIQCPVVKNKLRKSRIGKKNPNHSEWMKNRWKEDKEYKERMIEVVNTKEFKEKNSKILKGLWKDPNFRNMVVNQNRENLKKMWSEPEFEYFRQAVFEGWQNWTEDKPFPFTSKPQRELFGIVQEICPYPVLEYLCVMTNSCIDIAIPSLSIAIEYDGSYWHQGREEEDEARQERLECMGWSFIRYIDIVPPKEKILDDINKTLKGDQRNVQQ